LTEEILRPLISKRRLAQPACWALQQLSSPQLWSMGSVFIFQRRA